MAALRGLIMSLGLIALVVSGASAESKSTIPGKTAGGSISRDTTSSGEVPGPETIPLDTLKALYSIKKRPTEALQAWQQQIQQNNYATIYAFYSKDLLKGEGRDFKTFVGIMNSKEFKESAQKLSNLQIMDEKIHNEKVVILQTNDPFIGKVYLVKEDSLWKFTKEELLKKYLKEPPKE
jgi:hypothetical protein